MTPSMNMGAPKGTQAPVAGLAAIAQPAQAPKGKSPENMGQIMALARKMSDSQLADVLQGKSLDIPQYAAMTEAMGRKQLRNAVQGQQAVAQAKQPNLKDRLMAEQQAEMMPQGMPAVDTMGNVTGFAAGGAIDMNETAGAAGLDMLPAPNMDAMTMADGGIVAFSGGGDAEDEEPGILPSPSGFDKKLWKSIKEKFNEWNQPWGKTVEASPAEVRGALTGKNLVPGARPSAPVPAMTPDQLDAIARGQGVFPEGSVALPGGLTPDSLGRYVAKADVPPAKKSGLEQLVSGKATPPAVDERSQAEQDYLAKLAGLGEKTRGGIADIKNQAQSQVLLDTASALLSSRNLAEAGGKAGQLVAGRVGSMGKDMRSAEKEANEYDLNLAKARAALEAGDKDRAFKYQQAADENRYRMAMVNKPDSGIALLNALKDPEMMKLYQQMNMAKKPTDTIDREKAATLWEKLSRSKQKEYGDFDTYYRTMNNQLLSDTIPGQGANIRPYS